MSLKLTLSNNDTLIINRDTLVFAWNGADNVKNDRGEELGYYATSIFTGTLGGEINPNLSTADERVGMQGLLSSSDWFAVEKESGKLYQSSSVVSIEYIDD